MSELRKILYYENVLEFKENTGDSLKLNEVKEWKLCRTCLSDTGYEDFVDTNTLCIMEVDGCLANVEDMLADIAVATDLPKEFPHKICQACLKKITSTYFFKIQIKRAADVLKNLLEKLPYSKVDTQKEPVVAVAPSVQKESKDQQLSGSSNSETVECSSSTPTNIINGRAPVQRRSERKRRRTPVQESRVEKRKTRRDDATSEKSISSNEQQKEKEEVEEQRPVKEAVKVNDSFEEAAIADLENFEFEEIHIDDDNYEVVVYEKGESAAANEAKAQSEGRESDSLEFLDVEQPSAGRDDTWRFEMLIDGDDDSKDPQFKLTSECRDKGGKEKRERQRKSDVPLLESLECTICQMSFPLQRALIQHVQEKHPAEKAFRCRYCSNMFGHMQSLTRHMQTHKGGGTKFKCGFCEKGFMRADDLKRHLRIHTGEKPYVCELCKKGFKQPSELKAHTLSHTKEKRYKCELCSIKFGSRNGLYLHMKAHRGIKDRACTQCPMKFLTNSELKQHRTRVHGDKK